MSEHVDTMLQRLVVGLDGSPASEAALAWALANVAATGEICVVHTVAPEKELAIDAVLGNSTVVLRHRQIDLAGWVGKLATGDERIVRRVIEDHAARGLLSAADSIDADAVVVGQHRPGRHGPTLVGRVTAELIRRSHRPVVVVPSGWDEAGAGGSPIVVGASVSAASRAAMRWAFRHAAETGSGLRLVHAFGPRSLVSPDGPLELLAYHIDPTLVPGWVEEDIAVLANEISSELPDTGSTAARTIEISTGRIGRRLVDAADTAGLLVVGRGTSPFRRRAVAPHIRRVIEQATCPVVVVPAEPAR
jgi:nucleotide-binding universal stress UspA family protein